MERPRIEQFQDETTYSMDWIAYSEAVQIYCAAIESNLNNLLAIIHRDGGQHTGEVGLEQSVEDAHQEWGKRSGRIDVLESKLIESNRRLVAEEMESITLQERIDDLETKLMNDNSVIKVVERIFYTIQFLALEGPNVRPNKFDRFMAIFEEVNRGIEALKRLKRE